MTREEQRQAFIDLIVDAGIEYILTGEGFVNKPQPQQVVEKPVKKPAKKKAA